MPIEGINVKMIVTSCKSGRKLVNLRQNAMKTIFMMKDLSRIKVVLVEKKRRKKLSSTESRRKMYKVSAFCYV